MFTKFKYSILGKKFVSDSKTKKRGKVKNVTLLTNSWKQAYKTSKKFNSEIIRVN